MFGWPNVKLPYLVSLDSACSICLARFGIPCQNASPQVTEGCRPLQRSRFARLRVSGRPYFAIIMQKEPEIVSPTRLIIVSSVQRDDP